MKSIVLCEPSYGGQSKDNGSSDKSNKNGIKSAETNESPVKDDDSLSDIEICHVIGNGVNGGGKTDMRKDESKNTKEEEEEKKTSPDGDCAVGEPTEATDGASETFKDEEDIEIISCSIRKEEGVSESSKSSSLCAKEDNLGKIKESSTKDSNLLSNCIGNSTEQGSPEDIRTDAESGADGERCTTESKPAEEISEADERSRAGAEESESDRVISEVNTGRKSSIDAEVVQEKATDDEKIEDEFDGEETERGKQSSDEGFIEEEENKENRRGDDGLATADGEVEKRRKENGGTPIVECVESTWETEESFKSAWNAEKSELYGSQGSNGEEGFVAYNEMNGDEMETSDCEKNPEEGGKSLECHDSAEGNVAVSSSEKMTGVNGGDAAVEIECCPDVNEEEPEVESKSEEEMLQKRKRLSVDGGELVESSKKKRRTESNEAAEGEVRRRHSHDAAFTEKMTNESSHDSGNNEKESEKPENRTYKRNTLEESIDRVASAPVSLPFLESLRGTIKTLSRSDLEELIVQKLCEVITERSTVGDLRKKAQALEQDQERWKEKVQSLTKQLREMDMVMKKYMSEVQKQSKERNFQMVTPLRVTRSVGLQVSFGTPNAKMSKVVPNNSSNNQARQPVLQPPEPVAKQPPQLTVSVSQNSKKNQPALPSTQSKKSAKEQKKPSAPRVGVNVTFQARLISPQTVVAPNRTLQTQMNAVNRPRMPVADKNNSKIIDLTDDDDRQNGQTTSKSVLQPSVTVRPPGQIRVVNHIQPAQVNSGGRVAYLVPATTATASGSTVPPQGRQLLIATPTVQQPPRQLLPSVPPLLYKGSTILQPGAQQTLLNQTNRTLMPKKLKHPAPLPQPPANQIQKPNLKLLPPRPALKISKVQTGIVLSWNMTLGPEYEPIASYQLYAYQENNSPPATSLWKKVGDVKALPLPMACTLTQFMSGHKYYFAVRAVDLHSRIGPFSFPGSIVLIK